MSLPLSSTTAAVKAGYDDGFTVVHTRRDRRKEKAAVKSDSSKRVHDAATQRFQKREQAKSTSVNSSTQSVSSFGKKSEGKNASVQRDVKFSDFISYIRTESPKIIDLVDKMDKESVRLRHNEIYQEALKKIDNCHPDFMMKMVQACIKIDWHLICHDQFLLKMCCVAKERIKDFSNQGLVDLSSFFRYFHPHEKRYQKERSELFINGIAVEALARFNQFNITEIVQLARAFLYFNYRGDTISPLINGICHKILQEIRRIEPEDLTWILRAFSESGWRFEKEILEFAEAMGPIVLHNMRQYELKQLIAIALAFAIFDQVKEKEEIFQELEKAISPSIEKLVDEHQGLIALAFMVHTQGDLRRYIDLFSAILKNADANVNQSLEGYGLRYLHYHHAMICLGLSWEERRQYYPRLTRIIQTKLQSIRESQIELPKEHVQNSIAKTVSEILNVSVKTEHLFEGYSLDIVINEKEKISIEVDGMSHIWLRGYKRKTVIINDIWRETFLKRMGWKILHISTKDCPKTYGPELRKFLEPLVQQHLKESAQKKLTASKADS